MSEWQPIETAQKELRFGFMSPPLGDQLAGTGIASTDIAHFEADKNAILRLHIRGLIADRTRDRALRLLVKSIERSAATRD